MGHKSIFFEWETPKVEIVHFLTPISLTAPIIIVVDKFDSTFFQKEYTHKLQKWVKNEEFFFRKIIAPVNGFA